MNTQLILDGVAKVLYDRANLLGLHMIDEGTFATRKELKSTLDNFTDYTLDDDDIQTLLDQNYLVVDWEDINEIDIRTINHEKHVFAYLQDFSVIDGFTPIYDKTHQSWLLGFSNKGWLDIDSAIDLYTGTIGNFNSETFTYRPIKYLPSDTIEFLAETCDEYFFDEEKPNDKITRV